ncbi:MAG: hypothetical protein AMJ54_14225 [Deltaproteobacteria bacterium SG8_13]|nr:MAG: hypothetical protein AMJ54_14225 [Deltaproteobacteria bacterium SG8_13]
MKFDEKAANRQRNQADETAIAGWPSSTGSGKIDRGFRILLFMSFGLRKLPVLYHNGKFLYTAT